MKHIYLVRHGQTDANLQEYVPSKDEPLNATGVRQANELASRVSHIAFEKIFSSDFLRAQQTAEPIIKTKAVDIVVDPCFGEVIEPSSLFSVSENDELVQAHRKNRNENVENPDWRMEDGENFSDVIARINVARLMLEKDSAESILVNTHGFFIQLFTAAILLDTHTPTDAWFKLACRLKASNAGITFFTSNDNQWELVTFNDHAHFAE